MHDDGVTDHHPPYAAYLFSNGNRARALALMQILAIDHIQLAMPAGKEEAAREFYTGVLGFTEIPKPRLLASRGGAWFTSGTVQLHLGVEADFRPARKAHPAFRVSGLGALAERLRSRGYPVQVDVDLPGHTRFYVSDPFGNRLEFLQPQPE